MVASKQKRNARKPASSRSAKSSAKSARPTKPAKLSALARPAKSSRIHKSRARIRFSRLARSKEFNRKSYIFSRKTILTVIILAILTVILAVLFANFANPERVVKGKIESIAADYYENYFYERIESYSTAKKPFTEIMEHYVEGGFSKVPLRQLLLFDGERHADAAGILTTYCDENETFVTYFPYAPFSRTDYRIEYSYSCIF